MELFFLGTGGGRFVTYTQRRWTGGIRIVHKGYHIHIDPGPGAIVRCADMGLNPEKIRLLLVSHSHPDHCADAEIIIEGMARGTLRKRGTLIAPKRVLIGDTEIERSISTYHQNMVQDVIESHVGETYNVDDFKIRTTKAVHTDPSSVGYIVNISSLESLGYTSDTEYFENMSEYYQKLSVLVVCVLRPRGSPLKGHLTTEDAKHLIESTRPRVAILTHFGMKMLSANPYLEAAYIQKSTGIRTVAASDGAIFSVSPQGISNFSSLQKGSSRKTRRTKSSTHRGR